ncbi:MAG: MFS transporter [Chloroflexota bacterium]
MLFATRITRLFAYGLLSVVLVLYLVALGVGEVEIGVLLTLTLLGDTAVSLWMTTHADRLGRRRMLLAGAGLMVLGGLLFALTDDLTVLVLAATVGVISPSGNEVGPFLPIEQAALSQTMIARERTSVFAWYNLVGSFATALGALGGGVLAQVFQATGGTALVSYRAVILMYAALGLVLALLFTRLSPAAEATPRAHTEASVGRIGLHRSRGIVLRLSSLLALDAFAGGFVIQSIVAYWFHVRFGVEPALIGGILFGANILAGFSALAAARVARRIGLIRTMVFAHLPSNLLLVLVPLMPTLPLAIGVLLLRFSISQMDVPARQSYTMAVVSPDERSAAAGFTGVARTVGAGLSPMLVGPLLANPALLGVPFIVAGGLKIIYDLLLFRAFSGARPPEEEDHGKVTADPLRHGASAEPRSE